MPKKLPTSFWGPFEVPYTIIIQGIWNHNIGNYLGTYITYLASSTPSYEPVSLCFIKGLHGVLDEVGNAVVHASVDQDVGLGLSGFEFESWGFRALGLSFSV